MEQTPHEGVAHVLSKFESTSRCNTLHFGALATKVSEKKSFKFAFLASVILFATEKGKSQCSQIFFFKEKGKRSAKPKESWNCGACNHHPSECFFKDSHKRGTFNGNFGVKQCLDTHGN